MAYGDQGAAGPAGGANTGEWGGGRPDSGTGSAPGGEGARGTMTQAEARARNQARQARAQQRAAPQSRGLRDALSRIQETLQGLTAKPATTTGLITDDEIERMGWAWAMPEEQTAATERAIGGWEEGEVTKARGFGLGTALLGGGLVSKIAELTVGLEADRLRDRAKTDPTGALAALDAIRSREPEKGEGGSEAAQNRIETTKPEPTVPGEPEPPGRQRDEVDQYFYDTFGFDDPMPVGGQTQDPEAAKRSAQQRQQVRDTPALAYIARVNADIRAARGRQQQARPI